MVGKTGGQAPTAEKGEKHPHAGGEDTGILLDFFWQVKRESRLMQTPSFILGRRSSESIFRRDAFPVVLSGKTTIVRHVGVDQLDVRKAL